LKKVKASLKELDEGCGGLTQIQCALTKISIGTNELNLFFDALCNIGVIMLVREVHE
jgi:hypothetical protein